MREGFNREFPPPVIKKGGVKRKSKSPMYVRSKVFENTHDTLLILIIVRPRVYMNLAAVALGVPGIVIISHS